MRPAVISGVIILAVGGHVGYYDVYLKSQQEVHHIEEQIRTTQATQESKTELAASMQTIERYRKRLAPQPDVDWLVKQVTDIAKEQGLQLPEIHPQPEERLEYGTRLTVSLRLTCSYQELGRFVSRLESHEYFLHVDTLSIQHEQPPSSGPLDLHLTVSTCYVPPPSVGGEGV